MDHGTLGDTPDGQKKCETDCLLSEILNRIEPDRPNFWSYFAFLQSPLSPDHWEMFALGTEFDVYETVYNLY